MSNLIKIIKIQTATLIYIFKIFMIGYIHKVESNNSDKVKGIVIGIWRFQIQFTIGYSKELQETGELGNA